MPAVVDVVEYRSVPAKVQGAPDAGRYTAVLRATERPEAALAGFLVRVPDVYELRVHDDIAEAMRRTARRDVVLTIEDGEIVGVRDGTPAPTPR